MGAVSPVLLLALGVAPPGGHPFDKVILVPGKGNNPALLYVVLTAPRAVRVDHLTTLVVKHAEDALREAQHHGFKGTTRAGERPRHDGNVVFAIRDTRKDRDARITGFGVEQLREILQVSPARARQLVGRHSW